VAELVLRVGEIAAARALGLSRHTAARAAAGLPLHYGTRLVIKRWLDETESATTGPTQTGGGGGVLGDAARRSSTGIAEYSQGAPVVAVK